MIDPQTVMTVKMARELREQFAALCARRDLSTSQAIRRLMQSACARDAAQREGKAAETGDPLDITPRL